MSEPTDNSPDEIDADEVTQRPSRWENVVVGESKELLGHLLHNEELVENGEDQVEVAHEVHEEYEEEHEHKKD